MSKNEKLVTEALQQYETRLGSLTTAEINAHQISVVNRLQQEAMSRKSTYLQKLGELSSEIETPKTLEMFESLSRNPSFCSAFTCYQDSIFQTDNGQVSLTTQVYNLKLKPRTLLSCALVSQNQVSAYHL